MRKPIIYHGTEKVISIKGLYKGFGEREVLKGIDMDLYKGENLVVLGRSGIGKSVLLKIITGLMKPDSGSVEVLGKNVTLLGKKELDGLRLHIGYSFQNGALYDSMTLKENLAFPLSHHRKNLSLQERNTLIESTLDSVGLLQHIRHYPSELSGGQRKRAGIARTLIMRPAIMLYDEPTAGLDPITSEEINALIDEVQQQYKTSSIIITHDLTCAKTTGDRIMILVDGCIYRQGSFEEIFNTDDQEVKSFYDYNFVQ